MAATRSLLSPLPPPEPLIFHKSNFSITTDGDLQAGMTHESRPPQLSGFKKITAFRRRQTWSSPFVSALPLFCFVFRKKYTLFFSLGVIVCRAVTQPESATLWWRGKTLTVKWQTAARDVSYQQHRWANGKKGKKNPGLIWLKNVPDALMRTLIIAEGRIVFSEERSLQHHTLFSAFYVSVERYSSLNIIICWLWSLHFCALLHCRLPPIPQTPSAGTQCILSLFRFPPSVLLSDTVSLSLSPVLLLYTAEWPLITVHGLCDEMTPAHLTSCRRTPPPCPPAAFRRWLKLERGHIPVLWSGFLPGVTPFCFQL